MSVQAISELRNARRLAWQGLLAVALIAAVLGGALVFGGGALSPGGGGDSIGSLPGSWGGPGGSGRQHGNTGETGTGVATPLPQLALVGDLQQIRSIVTDAAGTGSVEVRTLDTLGRVEMIFHGHVDVWLDRSAFERSAVQVKLEISPSFGTSVARVQVDGHTLSRTVQPAHDIALGVKALSTSGILDQGAVVLSIVNAKHAKEAIEIYTKGNQIRMTQLF